MISIMCLISMNTVNSISNLVSYKLENAKYGDVLRNSSYPVNITFYDAEIGGNTIYNYSIQNLRFIEGDAYLIVNITKDINFNQNLWLETQINKTKYDRNLITSSLNVYEANNTQKLGDKLYSEYVFNNSGTWNIDTNATTLCIYGNCISTWDAINNTLSSNDVVNIINTTIGTYNISIVEFCYNASGSLIITANRTRDC